MKLIKWDFILLHRNQLVILTFVLTFIYLGIFFLLQDIGDLTTVLVVLLFNDPVVTGFLFSGVILLFEKNQNTIQAIKVSPLPLSSYILSKIITIAILATTAGFLITISAYGLNFNYFHLLFGLLGTSALFICFGITFASFSRTFNHFLFYTTLFLIIMALPFVAYAGLLPQTPFLIIPSFAGLILLSAAFSPHEHWEILYSYGYLSITIFLAYRLTIKCLHKIDI